MVRELHALWRLSTYSPVVRRIAFLKLRLKLDEPLQRLDEILESFRR